MAPIAALLLLLQTPAAPAAPCTRSAGGGEERIASGTRLRRDPDASSPSLAMFDVDVVLPVLERCGEWARVRWIDWKGWVSRSDLGATSLVTPSSWVDEEKLDSARALLGEESTLGPFRLLTDVEDSGRLARLAAIASRVPGSYRERYGLDPGSARREAVVLFAKKSRYEAFGAGENGLAGLEAHGHAGRGIAALHAEGGEEATRALLVHELTHLMNRKVFPGELPAWLEEGIAEDLAYCRVDSDGKLLFGTLFETVTETRIPKRNGWEIRRMTGGAATTVRQMAALVRSGQAPPLRTLLEMRLGEFVGTSSRSVRYAESGMFVRYLLDGGNEAYAAGFRAFLKEASAGAKTSGDQLLHRLGVSWDRLEAGYSAWLVRFAPRHEPF